MIHEYDSCSLVEIVEMSGNELSDKTIGYVELTTDSRGHSNATIASLSIPNAKKGGVVKALKHRASGRFFLTPQEVRVMKVEVNIT